MSNTFVYTLNGAVYINLTNRCSNACSFCLRQNGHSVTNNNSLWLSREPTANEVITSLKSLDFQYSEAVFCGYGESTYKLNEMLEISKFLHSIQKRTRLNTNGLGNQINNKSIENDLKGHIDVVSISLNASNAESYNQLCQSIYGKDAFQYILDFAKACTDLEIETILTVVDVIDASEIEICKALAQSVNAKLKVRKLIRDNVSYS